MRTSVPGKWISTEGIIFDESDTNHWKSSSDTTKTRAQMKKPDYRLENMTPQDKFEFVCQIFIPDV